MTAEPRSKPGGPPGPGPEDAGPEDAGPEHAGAADAGPGEFAKALTESDHPEPGEAEPGHGSHHHAAHTWEEARQAAYDAATPIPPGPVALHLALDRKLDQDIVALLDMPHYASSAMDGWAAHGFPWSQAAGLRPTRPAPLPPGG